MSFYVFHFPTMRLCLDEMETSPGEQYGSKGERVYRASMIGQRHSEIKLKERQQQVALVVRPSRSKRDVDHYSRDNPPSTALPKRRQLVGSVFFGYSSLIVQ
jgi:hypothetical protein